MILLFSIEAFHNHGVSISGNGEEYKTLFTIDQYTTVLILLSLIYVFHLKVKFTISYISEYYEEALDKRSLQITRWHDEIDTFL